jgi:DNA polymerase elongation subunit (family B)
MSIKKPKVLIYDIETAPILGYVWSLWENNLALNQIEKDWHLLSWSAKWLGSKEVMYMDQRNVKNIENDKKLLEGIWKLLDDADVVITQNGKSFDEKKLNARFLLNGMSPPSPSKHIDTLRIAKRKFAMTSTKLEYMSNKLCAKKKLKHKKFPGFELWTECMKGNKDAWEEMKAYNIRDVIALEELYVNHLQKWDNTDFNVYHDDEEFYCACGSDEFIAKGYNYTASGKYKRHKCKSCGKHYQSKVNLLSKEKQKSLLK